MQLTKKQINTAIPPVIREYTIGGNKYVVKATVKDGANEDAAAKIRRLLRKEINRKVDSAAEN